MDPSNITIDDNFFVSDFDDSDDEAEGNDANITNYLESKYESLQTKIKKMENKLSDAENLLSGLLEKMEQSNSVLNPNTLEYFCPISVGTPWKKSFEGKWALGVEIRNKFSQPIEITQILVNTSQLMSCSYKSGLVQFSKELGPQIEDGFQLKKKLNPNETALLLVAFLDLPMLIGTNVRINWALQYICEEKLLNKSLPLMEIHYTDSIMSQYLISLKNDHLIENISSIFLLFENLESRFSGSALIEFDQNEFIEILTLKLGFKEVVVENQTFYWIENENPRLWILLYMDQTPSSLVIHLFCKNKENTIQLLTALITTKCSTQKASELNTILFSKDRENDL